MSIFVFAGSAQFIAVSMLSGGANIISIVTTTFMVNSRHFLMSSALSIHLNKKDKKLFPLFAYGITDESFAINLLKFKNGDWDIERAIVINQFANFFWVISTILGGYFGHYVPSDAFGIDYALIAMFIYLLMLQLRRRKHIITAITAGVFSVLLYLVLPSNLNVVIASIFAATLGAALSKKYDGYEYDV